MFKKRCPNDSLTLGESFQLKMKKVFQWSRPIFGRQESFDTVDSKSSTKPLSATSSSSMSEPVIQTALKKGDEENEFEVDLEEFVLDTPERSENGDAEEMISKLSKKKFINPDDIGLLNESQVAPRRRRLIRDETPTPEKQRETSFTEGLAILCFVLSLSPRLSLSIISYL